MKSILTEKERNTLTSMSTYWVEVRKREDTSPLEHELLAVHRMIGTRLLDIVEEYIRLTTK